MHRPADTFPTKDSAVAWLADERKLIDLGSWTAPAERATKASAAKLTLRAFAKTWLKDRNISRRTRENYDYPTDLVALYWIVRYFGG